MLTRADVAPCLDTQNRMLRAVVFASVAAVLSRPRVVTALSPGAQVVVGGVRVQALSVRHHDPIDCVLNK